MNAQLVIREAQSEDLPVLISLLQILFGIETDFIPEPEKQRRGLELLLADERRSLVMLAEVADRVVGMCTAQLVVSTAEGAMSGWIEDLIVDQNYRGCGLGGSLLRAVEHWCFQRGASRVQLLADRKNSPALLFYAKMGWEETQLMGLRKFAEAKL